MYPENVRERLFEHSEHSKAKQTRRHASDQFTLINGEPTEHYSKHDDSEMSGSSSMPIAEKYQNTTILFADLAGFTQWSSTREPEEVFLLLETLYQAFDKIALRRRVFKIETIGDCVS